MKRWLLWERGFYRAEGFYGWGRGDDFWGYGVMGLFVIFIEGASL